MTVKAEKLKQLKAELKKWQHPDVKSRFDQVGSRLYLDKIRDLKIQINQLKNQ